jgi:hypothetical protein
VLPLSLRCTTWFLVSTPVTTTLWLCVGFNVVPWLSSPLRRACG